MRASPHFTNQDDQFWAYVRFLSERIGYSRARSPIAYSLQEAKSVLIRAGMADRFDKRVIDYLNQRTGWLIEQVKPYLMDVSEAEALYKKVAGSKILGCPLPMNKQKGSKKHRNHFTCLVNVLTEITLGGYFFDADPHKLITIVKDKEPVTVLSRRLDGVYPSPMNAQAVWEIKEYYDNKTFGSRIADGIYETLLDGYELRGLREKYGISVEHYLLIDSRSTWWLGGGIPYLCRLVDALHMGLVDEVIVGKEVVDRWPRVVKSWSTK